MHLFKKIKQVIVIFILLFTAIRAFGENDAYCCPPPCFIPKYLSLCDAIALALRNNPQIRSSELQRVVDRFALEVARNQFFPQYTFDTSATYSNGTKPFYTTNPKASLETIYGTVIDFGLRDQVNAGRETAAFIQVTQPLLRGGGSQIAQAQYKTALSQESINCLNFKETLVNTITTVIQNYYKLVQDYNNLHIDQLAINEAKKIFRGTELRIKAGKLAPTEIIQQQAQIANLKMALTRDKNSLAQDYREFLILLGLDPRSNLQIDKKIQLERILIPSREEAIEIALCKNIDYQRSLAKLKQLELLLLVAKDEQKWKLDLIARAQQEIIRNRNFATVDLNQIDAIGNDRPGGDRTLIINLNIPIHDLTRKQNLIRAKIALQQFRIALETQKQQLIAAVLNSIQILQAQATQLKLASQAVDFARQSLDVAQKKFLYGRTTMFEVITLQKSLTIQQLALVSEEISYVNNIAAFEKLLGTSLEKWCININGN